MVTSKIVRRENGSGLELQSCPEEGLPRARDVPRQTGSRDMETSEKDVKRKTTRWY